MKNKIITLILAALMTAPVLLSCSETTSQETTGEVSAETTPLAAEETAEETEPELSDDLPDTNMNGYTFRILSVMWGDEGAHRIMYEDYTGNPVNDALRDSTLYIEDRFNCKMTYISGGDGEAIKAFVTGAVTGGDDAYDIMINHDRTSFNMATQGLFYNMYDIEQFNFDKPWWQPTGELAVGNKLFCASTYLSYLGIHWTRAVMVNKDYMTNLGREIPYDMVREGKWTLDEMLALVADSSFDVNGDGKINKGDDIGFCTGSQTYYCLQDSLGLSAYKRDAEGNITLSVDVDRMDTAVQKIRALKKSNDYIASSGFGEDIFKSGDIMVCFGQIGDAYDIYRECDFTYGFLPSPKFDEYQESYINGCTDLPWAISKTITPEQADIIGTIVEAASCSNYKRVLPAYFDVAMKSRTADSPDDAEMLQLIADTRKISFAFSYSLMFDTVLDQLSGSNQEAASYFKGKESVATKMLNKLLDSISAIE